MLPKITSLADLRQKAVADDRYRELAFAAARNLGWDSRGGLEEAMRWIEITAFESGAEDGCVEEVNFVRDCIAPKKRKKNDDTSRT